MPMTLFPTALHHRLHQLARHAPDAPALVCHTPSTVRLTRGELQLRAARLAAVLRARGVSAETRVGVCIERSCDLFVALLAVLKAGGAFVPLDPRLPAERIEWMARDAGVRACIVATPASPQASLFDWTARIDMSAALDAGVSPFDGAPTHSHTAAYLIYTSGSTGRPKAVVVEHGPLAAHCQAVIDAYPMREADRVLHFATVGFDLAHEYWLAPLAAGASIVITGPDGTAPEAVRSLVEAEHVSIAAFPPAYLEAFAEAAARQGAPCELRILAFGGEAMSGDRFERIRAVFPGMRFINGYGPTETVISPMLWSIEARASVEAGDSSALSIGRPIGPRTARVVAAGTGERAAGELLLGGACLARGYQGRPALTAERFIPDEQGQPGARAYRTGDVACLREDGAFDYLGRLDDQVQVRGMRVEPGEIAQVLRTHPGVRDVAVLVDKGAGEARLIAFVAAAAHVGQAQLRNHLARHVPQAWLPARLLVVEALPYALSGKVDRQALLALAAAQPDMAPYRAPVGPTACALAQIWHAIVGGAPIGLDDCFFLRGGDSIGVMQMQSAIQARWAVHLPLAVLFEDHSLERLAKRVDTDAGTGSRAARASRIAGDDRKGCDEARAAPYEDHPASFAQRRFWVLARVGNAGDAYHVAAHWHLEGRIDFDALASALSLVVARHDAWRTTLVEDENGHVLQRVHKKIDVPIERVDLRETDPPQRDRRARALAEQWAAQPFDLSHGPLLRAMLVTFAEDRHRLMLTLHHAIGDAWSSRVAFDELAQAYAARCAGTAPAWPALPMRYADYARRQRQWLDKGARARQLAYWRDALADAPEPLALPLDRPLRAERTFEGARATRRLDPVVSQAVRALARETHGSTFIVLLAAFQAWLYRLTGARDVVVAAPVANRREGDLAALVGLFVNTVALRARIAPLADFVSLLAQVRRTTLDAYEHSDVPFDEVADAVKPPVRRGGDWLRVKFAQQFVFDQPVALPGAVARLTPGPDLAARFDFAIDFTDDARGIEFVAAWATDCVDTATAQRWLESFAALVTHAAREPSLSIALLDCHGTSASAVLTGPSRTFAFANVLEAFAHQAARVPHRGAVADDARELTFAQLDTASSYVARALKRRGVIAEDAVALGIGRSVDFVVALLGAMKAGAIAVPLDPAAPPARVAQSLAVCPARCLIVAEQGPHWPELAIEVARLSELEADGAALGRHDGIGSTLLNMDHGAYVIFTSGSTSTPKGVLVSHGALADYVQGMLAALAFEADASMAMVSTVAADLGHTALFGALCSGRTLHVLSASCAFDPDRFARTMRERGVGVLKIVPSHLHALLEAHDPQGVLPNHALVFGGEPLPRALVERVRALRPGCRVFNHYGPTEATVGALALELDHGETDPAYLFAATGGALPNVRACVLDEFGAPVPVGAYGELHLGGPGLARGYLARPGATAERFVPDPSGPAGARRYRTGDRVRVRADGTVQWAGRLDDQVKIRGYRVEPAEVSAALAAIDVVRQAETLAVHHERGARLVAFAVPITTARGPACDGATLRSRLAERLPDYMVPASVIVCDALPITANGKIDRAKLREHAEAVGDTREGAHDEPAEGAERLLAGVWTDLLRLERVGRDDNFFALGGDSILVLQAIARSRKVGIRFTPKQLFDRPTIALLADVAQRDEPMSPEVPEAAGAVDTTTTGHSHAEVVALTPAQHRFFALGVPNPHHWNQAVELEPNGPIDVEAFARALGTVLAHHDIFRLRFEPAAGDAGEWRAFHVERAFDDDALPLVALDVRDDDEALVRFDTLQRDIDVSRGPLVRALAATLPNGHTRVFIAVHHLIIDGVSWRIFLEDFITAYEAACMGTAPRLSAPARTAAPAWAARLARACASTFESTLPYWCALRDMTAALPRGMRERAASAHGGTQPAYPTHASARTLVRALDPSLTQTLLTEANIAWRTQTQDLLLAALAHALTDEGATGSCLVELEGHGREALFDDADASRTLGWLTSHYPVALPVASSVVDTLPRVKEALRAVPDRGLGFGVLRYLGDAATRAQLSALPRPRVTFNYLGRFEPTRGDAFSVRFGGVGCERDPAGPMANALAIHAFVDEARTLRVYWVYGSECFAAGAVEEIARRFETALQTLAAHCRERVAHRGGSATPSDFPLARRAGLTQATIDAAALDWRGVSDVYPLSPMQQGILFQSLLAPEQATYVNQLAATLDAPDVARLTAAFERTIGLHDVLRTGFLTEADPPQQVVHRRAKLPVALLDWRDDPERDFDAWLTADRARGFDMSAPPLMRLTLIRIGERTWRLVWTRHHLLFDGWSTARLFADVLRDYEQGPRPPAFRANPGVCYRDFIAWLWARDSASDRAFWAPRLARLDGPTLVARTDAMGVATPARWCAKLDGDTTMALADCARRLHLTINTIVQGAWALTLQRMTNQRTVAFGATVAGRPDAIARIETVVGLFINTLPVVATPSPCYRIAEWLAMLQNENAACAEHAQTPLFELQRWAGHSGKALFDTLIVFENYPVDEAWTSTDACALRLAHVRNVDSTDFAVTLGVHAGEQLAIDYGFDGARVSEARVRGLHRAFARCIEAFIADPSARLGALTIETAGDVAERVRCNATKRVWPARQCMPLHRQFEHQAATTPDATALLWYGADADGSCRDASLVRVTYAELDARAERAAAALRAAGATRDTPIALCLERSIEMVVALLGAMKAGAAWLPIDPDYPPQRIAYMLGDARPTCLVTQRALLDLVAPATAGAGSPPVLCIDALGAPEATADKRTEHTSDFDAQPDQLAYLIYTSGSTGHPKGAGNTHGALANRLAWMQDAYPLHSGDVVLQKTPFGFDVSVWECLWPVAVGATLALAAPGAHREPARLLDAIERFGVTTLHFVPSMLAAFLAHVETFGETARCAGIARIFASGETLPGELATKTAALLPKAALHNLYGPTEAAIDVSYWPCASSAPAAQASVPIGNPIANVQLHVLDAARQPLPVGAVGELFLGGAGLARGYHRRPSLTAERFIPDPFVPGARLYGTGDLVTRRADGALEYLGRIDQQVKLRGLRIEPGEIEAVLRAEAGVDDAVVLVRDARLLAYVARRADARLDHAGMRARLLAQLPAYMVPAEVVELDAIPLTPNGKCDRAALPSPLPAPTAADMAPCTETEHALAAIWAQVLRLERTDRIGREDDFFLLGGHSLLAAAAHARTNQRWALTLPLRSLFEARTLARCAAAVDTALAEKATQGQGEAARAIGALLDALEAN